MTTELLLVLGLLGVAVVLFAVNRPRMDAVALLMMVGLPFTGVITVDEALAGLSDPSVVLIAAMFVIGEGLVRTGVAQRLGDWLVARAGNSEARLIALLMTVVTVTGAFMSSTGVVAIFIPVALRIARNAAIVPSRLMMPLSVAALISGMMTLVATPPNLVIQGELIRNGFEGFEFFSFTPFGVPILALAIVYMLVTRRWLQPRGTATPPPGLRPRLREWVTEYSLEGRAYRLRLRTDSPLVGQTLDTLDLRSTSGINILAIERGGYFSRQLIQPVADTRLQAGDLLFLDVFGAAPDVDALCARLALEQMPLVGAYFSDLSQQIGMAELMVPAHSPLIGQTVLEARFRSRYHLNLIGLKRGPTAFSEDLSDEPLQMGDTLLVIGPWRAIRHLQTDTRDLLVLNLPVEVDDAVPAASRAPLAILALAVVVILMVTGIVPNVQAALIGCLLMGLFGCIGLDSSYRAIHWQSLILIVGMLPFSLALQKTGGIQLAADLLLGVVGDLGPRAVLAALFVTTAVFGLFISNTATAVLMAPVALAIAGALNASPYPFAMIVALAASSAFMTPVSSPVNTLVIGPGNYTFWDFVRIGVPFALISLLVCVLLVPWLLPL